MHPVWALLVARQATRSSWVVVLLFEDGSDRRGVGDVGRRIRDREGVEGFGVSDVVVVVVCLQHERRTIKVTRDDE